MIMITGSTSDLSRLARLFVLAVALAALSGCSTLPPPVARPPEAAIASSPAEFLGRVSAASLPPAQGASDDTSAFRPMPLSAFSMDARLTLARKAQRSLDLQYYLLQDDVTGRALLLAVRDAALRGVRVRLLVDDLYTAQSGSLLLALAAYPNVEIRLFNPFAAGRASMLTRWTLGLHEFSRINHRMHNKLFIADGAFAVAGGRNIADEYFFSSKGGNFVDFDLLVCGAALPAMQRIFDEYWNSPRVYPLQTFERSAERPEALRAAFDRSTADAVEAFPVPGPQTTDMLGFHPLSADIDGAPLRLLRGHIDVFADDPEKVSGKSESGEGPTTVTSRVGRAMSQARQEVVVGSPYFIPGKLGMDGMRVGRERGVRIQVITNSLASNDEPFASAAYGRYRVAMLKLGVELYETDTLQLKNDAFIHAALRGTVGRSHSKLIVIDRQTTFVGSMNLDFRSSRLNTEFGMLVHSTELAEMVLALADRVRGLGSYRLRLAQPGDRLEWVGTVDGVETVYDSDPGVSLGTRLQLLFLFPFVSES